MVRVTEIDGAYIVEVRVQTEQEKNIMSDLLDLNRQYLKEQDKDDEPKDLDSEFDMSKFAPEEIEEAPVIQEQPKEENDLDWMDEATVEEDNHLEEEMPF